MQFKRCAVFQKLIGDRAMEVLQSLMEPEGLKSIAVLPKFLTIKKWPDQVPALWSNRIHASDAIQIVVNCQYDMHKSSTIYCDPYMCGRITRAKRFYLFSGILCDK